MFPFFSPARSCAARATSSFTIDAVFSAAGAQARAGRGGTPSSCGSVSWISPESPSPLRTSSPRCSFTVSMKSSQPSGALRPARSSPTSRRFSSVLGRPARRSTRFPPPSTVAKLNRAATSRPVSGKSMPSPSRTPRPMLYRTGS